MCPMMTRLFQETTYQLVCYSPAGITPVSVKPKWTKLCQVIGVDNKEAVCKEVMSLELANKKCVEKVTSLVEKECTKLCSVNENESYKSILRKKTVDEIAMFSFRGLMEQEIKNKATTLYQILMAVINASGPERNVLKTKERKLAAAGMAVSILMKSRNKNMDAGQFVTSSILLQAGMTKMVSDINVNLGSTSINIIKIISLISSDQC